MQRLPRLARVCLGLLLAASLSACTSAFGADFAPVPVSTPTYYLHWQCGTVSQCRTVMGGQGGVYKNYTGSTAAQDCQNQVNAFATGQVIQPMPATGGNDGDWCDTTMDPTEPHP
jgi:hypothetical protein